MKTMSKKILAIAAAFLFAIPAWGQNVLWYNKPAQSWNEALPIGNGRIGAMEFGHVWYETIQLNEESLWAGCKTEGDADAAKYIPEIQKLLLDGKIKEGRDLARAKLMGPVVGVRSYQSFGELKIQFNGMDDEDDVPSYYRRELDLSTGIAKTVFQYDGVTFTREVLSSAPDDILAIKFTADKPGALNFRVLYSREQDAGAYVEGNDVMVIKGQIIDFPAAGKSPAGPQMKFAGRVKGQCKGGKLFTANQSIYVVGATEATLYVAMNTDYDVNQLNFDHSIDPAAICKKQIDAAPDFATVKQRHLAEYQSMFNRVALT